MHHWGRHLHSHWSGIGMAVAALSCTAKAWARIPQCNSSNPGGLSAVTDCSGFCCRSGVATAATAATAVLLVQGSLCWTCISAEFYRRSMALRQFPYVTCVAELGLWHSLFCLRGPCRISLRSL